MNAVSCARYFVQEGSDRDSYHWMQRLQSVGILVSFVVISLSPSFKTNWYAFLSESTTLVIILNSEYQKLLTEAFLHPKPYTTIRTLCSLHPIKQSSCSQFSTRPDSNTFRYSCLLSHQSSGSWPSGVSVRLTQALMFVWGYILWWQLFKQGSSGHGSHTFLTNDTMKIIPHMHRRCYFFKKFQ